MKRPRSDLATGGPAASVSPAASIREPAPEFWRVLAQVQLDGAERALAMVEAARWDGHRFVLPHPDSILGLGPVEVPPEFNRGLHLGRLREAIKDRIRYWREILRGGRAHCLWCQQVLPTALLPYHAGRHHTPT